MTARSSDAPPQVLAGRFELREVLGQGGMATVWSAHDRRLDRQVAIKLLRADLPADQTMRIEREARAAARITDPRVVTVLDLDHTPEGRPFLVMQAHGGHTLADDLRRGPIARARVERLVDDVVGALAAAHDEGVLHRDLKPANILSDPDGYRLTDFGIASLDDDLETNGDLLGTLAYVAPERFDGHPATAQSDVFALGVVLHEALTGRQPFRGDSPGDTMRRIRLGITAPLPADTPLALARLVTASLSPDPTHRPADGRAMRDALVIDLRAPTERIEIGDATERLDHTAVLRATPAPTNQPPPVLHRSHPHPRPRDAGPDIGARLAGIRDALGPVARRGAANARRMADRSRSVAAGNPSAAVAAAAVLVVVLVLVVALLATSGGGPEFPATPAPSTNTVSPGAQLDADLDRIAELGR